MLMLGADRQHRSGKRRVGEGSCGYCCALGANYARHVGVGSAARFICPSEQRGVPEVLLARAEQLTNREEEREGEREGENEGEEDGERGKASQRQRDICCKLPRCATCDNSAQHKSFL